MSKKLRWLLAVAVLLCAVAGWLLWPFMVGERNMRAFCAALPVGESVALLHQHAAREGYRVSGPDAAGRAIVHEPRSLGRFLCNVQFSGGQMVSAAYQHND